MPFYLRTKSECDCCGCGACIQICPVNCINTEINNEGFSFPIIDNDRCIDCGKCEDVCPFKEERPSVIKKENLNAYAAYSNDNEIIKRSSSGGVFPVIAAHILKNEGLVFGAKLDQKRNIYHFGIDKLEDLATLQGSKYIQSDTRETFKEVKHCLHCNRLVLYVGTPCQIAGLKRYLGREYHNLYTIDVICHGVPSKLVFDQYVNYLEDHHNGQLTTVDFRDKRKFGWSITLRYEIVKKSQIKSYYVPSTFSEYFYGFLTGVILRESCYHCKFTSLDRVADITLADYWGFQKVLPEIKNDKGLSLLFINSLKGERIFETAGHNMWKMKLTPEQACVEENINLYRPTNRPKERDFFYVDLQAKGFSYVAKKYLRPKNYYFLLLKSKTPKFIKQTFKRLFLRT